MNPLPDNVLRLMPVRVLLWFGEDLNGSASKIVVWDDRKHVVTGGHATLVPGFPRQLTVNLERLHPGTYRVLWTSVSAVDGQVLRGTYVFSYLYRTEDPPVPAAYASGMAPGFAGGLQLAQLPAHWIELLAAIGWAGMAICLALIPVGGAKNPSQTSVGPDPGTRPPCPVRGGLERHSKGSVEDTFIATSLRLVIPSCLVALLAASLAVLLLQAYSLAGASWSGALSKGTVAALLAGRFGRLWLLREALALAALILVFVRSRSRTWWTRGTRLTSPALALLYLYLLAASGHAASDAAAVPGTPLSAAMAASWVHLIGASLLLAGQSLLALAGLVALRRPNPDEPDAASLLAELGRAPALLCAGIALLAIGGAVVALIRIPSPALLLSSTYGRALLAKTGILALILLADLYAAALTGIPGRRATGTPGLRRLSRWLALTPILGAGALLGTSIMFFSPLPPRPAPFGISSYVVMSSGLVAYVHITPNSLGANTISVRLQDRAGGAVGNARVIVLTNMQEMDMGTGRLELRRSGPDSFTGRTVLGMGGGTWRFVLLIYRPSGLVRLSLDDPVAA